MTVDSPQDPQPSTSAHENLFGCILASESAYFCSQQRDAEDLSDEEKLGVLDNLFRTNPSVFLQRYHRLLLPEHKKYFVAAVDPYSADFYFDQLSQQGSSAPKRCNTSVRNARYLALMKLKADGDYFSNAKMREREPLLFDKMVGRFLTDQEKVYLRPTVENSGTLSGLMDEFDQAQRISDRRQNELSDWSRQEPQTSSSSRAGPHVVSDPMMRHADNRLAEEEFQPEYESDDESEEALQAMSRRMKTIHVDRGTAEPSPTPMEESAPGSSCEDDDTMDQEMLREEFVSHMEQRFLNGNDEEFYDYSQVDAGSSKEYDKIREQDLEDKYFDSD